MAYPFCEKKILKKVLIVEKVNFIPFFISANLFFGEVKNLKVLEKLFEIYSYSELKKMVKSKNAPMCFSPLCKEGKSFGVWVKENNLEHYFIGNIKLDEKNSNFWRRT